MEVPMSDVGRTVVGPSNDSGEGATAEEVGGSGAYSLPKESHSSKSDLRRAGKSIQWKVVGSFAERVLNIVSLAIMARLVTKADYGLVGLAQIAFGLVGMLRDLGLSEAIIRAPQATPLF